ncbi:MAG: hypothetical protein EOQ28_14880 [Mesorhizobium sp.]|uniref:hypothetical protein n=1 Tax=Mesorhizobium sp. TaxID=1871066 RepID=UPI000FE92ED1|nr:hypothetical protein [Mesorhizobium sp.]RWA73424.1 MAG: hypothetical protein EOQ28_14880 [Mesorhizobium sp.]
MLKKITASADGGALPNSMVNRRLILAGMTSLPAMAGATASATAKTITPLERFNAALAEFKAAAEALDPRIYDWTIKSNGDLGCGLLIAAWRQTTVYEGDGWYAVPHSRIEDDRVFVERSPKHDRNGERWFRITSYYGNRPASAVTPESSFIKEYGRKLSL